MKKTITLISVMALAATFPAYTTGAQEAEAPVVTEESNDYARRLELARQLEASRPMAERVDDILSVLAVELPAEDRERFKSDIMGNIDMGRLEGLSIATMAQVFTAAELGTMIAYYNMPEAESITEKSTLYRRIVDSEISREIQLALNRLMSAPPAPPAVEPPAEVVPPEGEATPPATQ